VVRQGGLPSVVLHGRYPKVGPPSVVNKGGPPMWASRLVHQGGSPRASKRGVPEWDSPKGVKKGVPPMCPASGVHQGGPHGGPASAVSQRVPQMGSPKWVPQFLFQIVFPNGGPPNVVPQADPNWDPPGEIPEWCPQGELPRALKGAPKDVFPGCSSRVVPQDCSPGGVPRAVSPKEGLPSGSSSIVFPRRVVPVAVTEGGSPRCFVRWFPKLSSPRGIHQSVSSKGFPRGESGCYSPSGHLRRVPLGVPPMEVHKKGTPIGFRKGF
jgi:hypothetical protein